MLQAPQARSLAEAWIQAWNSHDLESILAHYAEEIRFHSPFVSSLMGRADGEISGKAVLREYFSKGLAAYPDLHFKLTDILLGMDSLVLLYDSVGGKKAAESMLLDAEGRIVEVRAHYGI